MSVASQVYEGWHRRRRRKEVAATVPSVTIIESPDYSSSSNMGNENESLMLEEEDCTKMRICSNTSSPAVAKASSNRPLPTRIEDHTRGSKKCRSRLSKPTIRYCWIVLIIAIGLICNNNSSSCYAFQSTNNNYGRICNNIATTNHHRRRMVS